MPVTSPRSVLLSSPRGLVGTEEILSSQHPSSPAARLFISVLTYWFASKNCDSFLTYPFFFFLDTILSEIITEHRILAKHSSYVRKEEEEGRGEGSVSSR